jgi:protoheme IX farnesyltransferase
MCALQLYEVANDSRMSRTCNRPLPAGRMTRLQAAAFALAAGTAGLGILYTQVHCPVLCTAWLLPA